MLTPDVFLGFLFHVHTEKGKLRFFKSQHSVLFHTDLSSSLGSGHEGEEHVSDFGVKVGFCYNVEVRVKGTVVWSTRNLEVLAAAVMQSRSIEQRAVSALQARGISILFQFVSCPQERASLPVVRTGPKLNGHSVCWL